VGEYFGVVTSGGDEINDGLAALNSEKAQNFCGSAARIPRLVIIRSACACSGAQSTGRVVRSAISIFFMLGSSLGGLYKARDLLLYFA
jgi:hypothetical protein